MVPVVDLVNTETVRSSRRKNNPSELGVPLEVGTFRETDGPRWVRNLVIILLPTGAFIAS